MESVQQRVAVVTGGNRGIGLAVANVLASHGVHVVVGGREPSEAEAAAAEISGGGRTALGLGVDVTDGASVAAFAECVASQCGRVDILVNNAGVALDKRVPALEVDMDVFLRTMDVNVHGALRVMQAIMPMMLEAGYGRVVNVSSVLGSLSQMSRFSVAYRASKTALNALTRVIAAEYRDEDILVNSVCPGWVRTEIGGDQAPRAPEQAAAGVVWAATLPAGGPTGGFFRDREPLPW